MLSTANKGLLSGLLLWLLATLPGYGQIDSLNGLTGKLARYQQAALPEKLFLHLDRPTYLSGETMWFKVYAVDGTYGRPLALSTVAYVEVLNREQQPVLQGKIALKKAKGQGSFSIPASLASGTYTVRAYTSWMKNFGPEYYFQQPVTIINTSATAGIKARKDSAAAYDVQFFPEGGNLVQGLSSKVALKVTDRTGRGIAAEGKILNQQGAVVAQFKTLRFGMGSFRFTPAAGASYTAVVSPGKLPAATYKLPTAYEQGYAMRLESTSPTSVTVSVAATTTQPETLYLLVHSRQKVVVAARQSLLNGQALFTIDRGQLLDGVSHFTLFNAAQQPLCERLYFQAPRQTLTITARPDKNGYTTRDKVSVQVATAAASQPVGASVSMAVYRLDSLTSASIPDITSYLWLAADLRGTIEQPEYYFSATSPEVAEATDNLMLTQGWSRFDWKQVLAAAPVAFEFLPELNGHLVRGRLTQTGTNRPVPGITTYLSAPSRITRLQNAVSGANGVFQFELNHFYGPQDIIVQTDPQQDSTCQIEVFSPFSPQYAAAVAGGPALPRFEPDYAKRHFQQQVQTIYSGKYANRITMPAPDSTAFFGKPDEIYLLDKYTRFKVLEEVMREYVPGVDVRIRKDGFHFLVKDKINGALLTQNPMVLLDGVPVFNINKMMAMDPLKIQKLEVMDSRYVHGTSIYDGIVSFTTYKGNLAGFSLDPRVLVQAYEGVQGQREFYAPRYETPEARQSRLPDFRNLLYWNPDIATAAGAGKSEFYTGDQAGQYLIVIQGLSDTGLAGSARTILEVKPAL